ncbi:MAG: hypothetical protein Q8P41_04025 [Pseudomonadota bacterium]|nr:hypothetical protein [Pseudomonadota bacterium]
MNRYSVLLLALAACCTTREATAPVEPPTVPTVPTVPSTNPPPTNEADATGPDTWTIGNVDVAPVADAKPVKVTAVRVGAHEGFERIVLEFEGDRVPGHHLEYIDRPAHDCASGAPRDIEGDGLLLVQVQPATAHDDAGAETTPKESKPGLPVVREIERTCDFEAVVAYVVGVGAPTAYRAFELTAPARLVIDIKQ